MEQVLLNDCSYHQSDICACMEAVIDGWQLPGGVGYVKVSIRVQTSAGELPPERSSGAHAWDAGG